MRKIIQSILLIILIISIHLTVLSINPPLPPEILSVEILHSSGLVRMDWNDPPEEDYDGFILFYTDPDSKESFGVDTVLSKNQRNSTFSYPEVNNHPVIFTISSFKDTIVSNSTDRFWQGTFAKRDTTIFLSFEYDSCKSTLDLNWTNYGGWPLWDSIYEIEVNGQIIAATNQNNWTINKINKNDFYEIHIISKSGLVKTSSNFIELSTYSPGYPQFINLETININGGAIDFMFQIDPNYENEKFILFKIEGDSLISMDEILSPAESQKISIPLPSEGPWGCYKLSASDICNNPVISSNMACPIFLDGTVAEGSVDVFWTEYQSWLNGVETYKLYRDAGTGWELINEGLETYFSDNINGLIDQNFDGEVFYKVEALENGGISSQVSSSNIKSFDLLGDVYAPDAFTPNGDNLNDYFIPKLLIEPTFYKMSIYSGWGTQVFSTTDYESGWDGKSYNGKPVPQGIYLYTIEFTTQSGKKGIAKKTITVVYP